MSSHKTSYAPVRTDGTADVGTVTKRQGVHLNVKGSYHHDQIHTLFLAKILDNLQLWRKLH